MQKDYSIFIKRRAQLIEAVKSSFPQKKGSILLFAGFETEKHAFQQESSFYYYTGLEEPGVVLLLHSDGSTVLYIPQYTADRKQWVTSVITENADKLTQWGFNEVRFLGAPCRGYSLIPSCLPNEYENLLTFLQARVRERDTVFTEYPAGKITGQNLIVDRLLGSHPEVKNTLTDISSLIGSMRRIKSSLELESIYEAIDSTMTAHEWASTLIEPGLFEYQLQASIEFVFKSAGGSPAFPSVVASGKNSTVLHYTRNDREMRKGDLVVIDIGAKINHYCADLARTYPVSGTFTDRQRQVYDSVLATQDYLVDIARPGYWISNKDVPEKSLHHLAVRFLKERGGYDKYFNHMIGHFLGLDVHDVGDYAQPLKEGDVLTLEPGIYIPEEMMGIRIEDNYWMTNDKLICLSEELPRDSYEIEEMMKSELEDDE
ncbi:aminopeptidase P N-terminal domain-containing protein [Candidatus Dependentiae bacterium]|nr:aminopeptidase P N-terminal domain-containing protein [Candidatus Dependentiae bacterium]